MNRLGRTARPEAASATGTPHVATAERHRRRVPPRSLRPRPAGGSGRRDLAAVPGLSCAALCRSARAVDGAGGDWVDLFGLPAGVLGVAIGDVMGHDARAGRHMRQLRAAVRRAARSGGSPGKVLESLDAAFFRTGEVELATVLYGRLVLDTEGALLLYSNAGHLPPLLRAPDGSVSRLTAAASPLLGAPLPASTHRLEAAACLSPGSTLLLYTDGLVEGSRGSRRDVHDGIDRLAQLLREAGPGDVGPLCSRLLAELVDDEPADDIALLALHLDPAVGPSPV